MFPESYISKFDVNTIEEIYDKIYVFYDKFYEDGIIESISSIHQLTFYILRQEFYQTVVSMATFTLLLFILIFIAMKR